MQIKYVIFTRFQVDKKVDTKKSISFNACLDKELQLSSRKSPVALIFFSLKDSSEKCCFRHNAYAEGH